MAESHQELPCGGEASDRVASPTAGWTFEMELERNPAVLNKWVDVEAEGWEEGSIRKKVTKLPENYVTADVGMRMVGTWRAWVCNDDADDDTDEEGTSKAEAKNAEEGTNAVPAASRDDAAELVDSNPRAVEVIAETNFEWEMTPPEHRDFEAVNVPRGLQASLFTFRCGEKARVKLSAEAAFGVTGNAALGVPPNSQMIWEVFCRTVAFPVDISPEGATPNSVTLTVFERGPTEYSRCGLNSEINIDYQLVAFNGDNIVDDGSYSDQFEIIHDTYAAGSTGFAFNIGMIEVPPGLEIAVCKLGREAVATVILSPEFAYGTDEEDVQRVDSILSDITDEDRAAWPHFSEALRGRRVAFRRLRINDFDESFNVWEYETEEEKRLAGEEASETGKHFVQRQKYFTAKNFFLRANDCYDQLGGRATEDDRAKSAEALISVIGNLCLCALKLNDFQGAIRYATLLLRSAPPENSLQIAKAHFRRGVALMETAEHVAAAEDLAAARALEPEDPLVHAKLKELEEYLEEERIQNEQLEEALGKLQSEAEAADPSVSDENRG